MERLSKPFTRCMASYRLFAVFAFLLIITVPFGLCRHAPALSGNSVKGINNGPRLITQRNDTQAATEITLPLAVENEGMLAHLDLQITNTVIVAAVLVLAAIFCLCCCAYRTTKNAHQPLIISLGEPETHRSYPYLVTIDTCYRPGAGGKGRVKVSLQSGPTRSPTYVINTDIYPNVLKRGGSDHFLIYTDGSMGKLSTITVEYEAETSHGWYCDHLTVTDVVTKEKVFFPCGRWLKADPFKSDWIVLLPGIQSRFAILLGNILSGQKTLHIWWSVLHSQKQPDAIHIMLRLTICFSIVSSLYFLILLLHIYDFLDLTSNNISPKSVEVLLWANTIVTLVANFPFILMRFIKVETTARYGTDNIDEEKKSKSGMPFFSTFRSGRQSFREILDGNEDQPLLAEYLNPGPELPIPSPGTPPRQHQFYIHQDIERTVGQNEARGLPYQNTPPAYPDFKPLSDRLFPKKPSNLPDPSQDEWVFESESQRQITQCDSSDTIDTLKPTELTTSSLFDMVNSCVKHVVTVTTSSPDWIRQNPETLRTEDQVCDISMELWIDRLRDLMHDKAITLSDHDGHDVTMTFISELQHNEIATRYAQHTECKETVLKILDQRKNINVVPSRTHSLEAQMTNENEIKHGTTQEVETHSERMVEDLFPGQVKSGGAEYHSKPMVEDAGSSLGKREAHSTEQRHMVNHFARLQHNSNRREPSSIILSTEASQRTVGNCNSLGHSDNSRMYDIILPRDFSINFGGVIIQSDPGSNTRAKPVHLKLSVQCNNSSPSDGLREIAWNTPTATGFNVLNTTLSSVPPPVPVSYPNTSHTVSAADAVALMYQTAASSASSTTTTTACCSSFGRNINLTADKVNVVSELDCNRASLEGVKDGNTETQVAENEIKTATAVGTSKMIAASWNEVKDNIMVNRITGHTINYGRRLSVAQDTDGAAVDDENVSTPTTTDAAVVMADECNKTPTTTEAAVVMAEDGNETPTTTEAAVVMAEDGNETPTTTEAAVVMAEDGNETPTTTEAAVVMAEDGNETPTTTEAAVVMAEDGNETPTTTEAAVLTAEDGNETPTITKAAVVMAEDGNETPTTTEAAVLTAEDGNETPTITEAAVVMAEDGNETPTTTEAAVLTAEDGNETPTTTEAAVVMAEDGNETPTITEAAGVMAEDANKISSTIQAAIMDGDKIPTSTEVAVKAEDGNKTRTTSEAEVTVDDGKNLFTKTEAEVKAAVIVEDDNKIAANTESTVTVDYLKSIASSKAIDPGRRVSLAVNPDKTAVDVVNKRGSNIEAAEVTGEDAEDTSTIAEAAAQVEGGKTVTSQRSIEYGRRLYAEQDAASIPSDEDTLETASRIEISAEYEAYTKRVEDAIRDVAGEDKLKHLMAEVSDIVVDGAFNVGRKTMARKVSETFTSHRAVRQTAVITTRKSSDDLSQGTVCTSKNEYPVTNHLVKKNSGKALQETVARYSTAELEENLDSIARDSMQRVTNRNATTILQQKADEQNDEKLQEFAGDVVEHLCDAVTSKLRDLIQKEHANSPSENIENILAAAERETREQVIPRLVDHVTELIKTESMAVRNVDIKLSTMAYAGEYLDAIITNAVLQTHAGIEQIQHDSSIASAASHTQTVLSRERLLDTSGDSLLQSVMSSIHKKLESEKPSNLGKLQGTSSVSCGLCRPKAIEKITEKIFGMTAGRYIVKKVLNAAKEHVEKMSVDLELSIANMDRGLLLKLGEALSERRATEQDLQILDRSVVTVSQRVLGQAADQVAEDVISLLSLDTLGQDVDASCTSIEQQVSSQIQRHVTNTANRGQNQFQQGSNANNNANIRNQLHRNPLFRDLKDDKVPELSKEFGEIRQMLVYYIKYGGDLNLPLGQDTADSVSSKHYQQTGDNTSDRCCIIDMERARQNARDTAVIQMQGGDPDHDWLTYAQQTVNDTRCLPSWFAYVLLVVLLIFCACAIFGSLLFGLPLPQLAACQWFALVVLSLAANILLLEPVKVILIALCAGLFRKSF